MQLGQLLTIPSSDEDVDGFDVLTELLVDAKSFFVELVLGFSGNISKLKAIVVV